MSDDPLVDLVDEALLQEAVAERSRGRLLAEAEADDTTLAHTMRSLAGQGVVLVVATTTGHQLRGRVVAIATDHLVLRGEHGTTWVAAHAVVSVRTRPGVRVRASEPLASSAAHDRPLVEALRDLHEERAHVQVLLPGTEPVRGRLVEVGRDVATIAADGGGGHVLVATDRVVAVTTEDA